MAQRKQVGLLYTYDERWIGGTYYVLNIINALHRLPKKQQPIVVLFTENAANFEEVKKITSYQYLKLHILERKLTEQKIFWNKVFKKLFGVNVFKWTPPKATTSILYPKTHPYVNTSNLKQVFWIPDFQEAFLPQLFTSEDIEKRQASHKKVSQNADVVVFSSNNAAQHFKSLYPEYTRQIKILHFAVTHPSLEHLNKREMTNKYSLDRPYFFAPNQFWQHKNHETLIEAVFLAKKENADIKVLLSGKEEDYRTEGHVEKLKQMVLDKGLSNEVSFLGFLPRDEQLYILKNCIAVIQPSLFEGWSTVVEDAKAQGKYIILSDIPVHREQVEIDVSFFNPLSPNELANAILSAWQAHPIANRRQSYDKNVILFAREFMTLLD